MAANDSTEEPQTRYAVGLEHMFWMAADSEEEAIEQGIQAIAELDEDDLRTLDIDVFDVDEF